MVHQAIFHEHAKVVRVTRVVLPSGALPILKLVRHGHVLHQATQGPQDVLEPEKRSFA